MAITLVQELFAYVDTGGEDDKVVALQLWKGFARGQSGFVMVVNGAVEQQHNGPASKMTGRFTAAGSVYPASAIVDADDAYTHLRRITSADLARCADRECLTVLPMGGLWCARCGRPQHKA